MYGQFQTNVQAVSEGQSAEIRIDSQRRLIITGDGSSPIPTTGGDRTYVTATIPNGQALSDWIDLGANRLAVGLQMPAGWTPAVLSFQNSIDAGLTPKELRDTLSALHAQTVDADYDVALDGPIFARSRYLRLRSGTAAVPVNQGGSRAIILTTMPF